MEMSLARDDKKAALCHSLIGGTSFFLREVHKIMYFTVVGIYGIYEAQGKQEIFPVGAGSALSWEYWLTLSA